jgi:hypothetical protein
MENELSPNEQRLAKRLMFNKNNFISCTFSRSSSELKSHDDHVWSKITMKVQMRQPVEKAL